MEEIKRLAKILNIELAAAAVILAAAFGAIFGLTRPLLFFLLFLAALILILKKSSATLTKSIIADLADRTRELAALKETLGDDKTVLEIKIEARTRELKELADGLENRVVERTQELKAKLAELERFQKLTIGRELKMIELKQKIEKFEKNAKKK